MLNDDRHRGDHRRGKSSHGRPDARARKLAVRNEVALSHHTAVRKDLAQFSRVTAQSPQARGPQRVALSHHTAVRKASLRVAQKATSRGPQGPRTIPVRPEGPQIRATPWQAERLLELQRKQTRP